MSAKLRRIEIDEETADLLEARAAARGISIGELLADMVGNEAALPADLAGMRARGEGPWSPAVLADDAQRLSEFERTRLGTPWGEVKAWMQTWGTSDEVLPPKPRKL
jgi:hypothetical protein